MTSSELMLLVNLKTKLMEQKCFSSLKNQKKLFLSFYKILSEGFWSEGFKRPVYWNKYEIIANKKYNENDYIRELLHASYQGVERLFVLVYRNRGCANRLTADSHRRYFLPKVKIKNYNIEIDKRNLYDESVNDLIKQHDEVRKVSTGQGDD